MKWIHCGCCAIATLFSCVDAADGQCPNDPTAAVFGFRRIIDSQPVSGVTVTLSAVSHPSGACAAGGNAVVDFTFRNIVGSGVNKLTAIWFDDECSVPPGMPLMSLCEIIGDNSNGHIVHFAQGATPHEPPNREHLCPTFHTTLEFSADSDPNQVNAVDEGEFIILRFTLHAGRTLNDVVTCLRQSNANANPCVPGLRIAFNLDTPGGGGLEHQ